MQGLPMSAPLFRTAAVAHQGERLAGALLLNQPVSVRLVVLLIMVLTSAVLLWLGCNSYQRKVPVAGTVEPDSVVVELVVPQAGTIVELAVGLDQSVEKGQKLFVIETGRTLESGLTLEAGSLETQRHQQAALQQQIRLAQQKLLALDANFGRRIALAASIASMWDASKQHQQQLLELRQSQADRGWQLLQRGVQAASDQENLQAQLLLQQQSVADTAIQLQHASAGKTDLEIERDNQLMQARQDLARLQSEAELDHRQLLQLQLEHRQVVVAPVPGLVSSLQLRQGMSVRTQQPALSLLPATARLQAELKVPSQAVGFLRAGQRVSLRLDAFPYQKFGVQHATLASMARSTEYSDRAGPEAAMPYYRLVAELDKQTVQAYGREMPLRPGMRLAADINVDSRTLLEWLLEPLYSIRGH